MLFTFLIVRHPFFGVTSARRLGEARKWCGFDFQSCNFFELHPLRLRILYTSFLLFWADWRYILIDTMIEAGVLFWALPGGFWVDVFGYYGSPVLLQATYQGGTDEGRVMGYVPG
jgi:hypothetical protein